MTTRRVIAAALGLGALVLLAVALAVQITDEPVSLFVRDLHALSEESGADLPFYAGSLSILNGWVWAAGAALAVVTGVLVPQRRRWMGVLAFLLLMIAADDALMLHEEVGPPHGVPDRVFYLVYAVTGCVLLLSGRHRWREHTMVAFGLGGAFLALSIGSDVVVPDRSLLSDDGVKLLIEDGAKLFGALMWLSVPVLALGDLTTTRPGVLDRPEHLQAPGAPPQDREVSDAEDHMTARPMQWAASLVSGALVR
jgi:hypothetical protein